MPETPRLQALAVHQPLVDVASVLGIVMFWFFLAEAVALAAPADPTGAVAGAAVPVTVYAFAATTHVGLYVLFRLRA